ncbi:MAG: protein-disulfide reductase DsbD family protein [Candidatus Omnitrophota bacterium]
MGQRLLYAIKKLKFFLGILCVCSFTPSAFSQTNPIKLANTLVEIIPQFETIKEGQTFWVGLSFIPDKDWHVYWRNPGDSGLAPQIQWQLPNEFHSGEIIWPVPERIEAGPLVTFGYHHETFLLTEIKSPPSFENQNELVLSAKVSWLACKEECIPGVAHFTIRIPVTQETPTLNQRYYANYNRHKTQYPVRDVLDAISVGQTQNNFIVRYNPSQFIEGMDSIHFFPYDENIVDFVAFPEVKVIDQTYEIILKKSLNYQPGSKDRFRGIFAFSKKNLGSINPVEIDVPVTQNNPVKDKDETLTGLNTMGIPIAIIFAFLGGLILNLMPCVLPVLTIKILSLVDKSRVDGSKLLNNGVQFTLGILVSFWLLAAFMLLLRLLGKQIGWGYQFQSPYFVVSMAILFFLLALNLFGLFEMGTGLTRLKSTEFAFLNGVLATVVATPCTAPFMGSAIGFALTKPPVYTFIIFTSVGMGMAFPYLLLTRFPQLLKFVPKPGQWMVYLKQLFGFVMVAVVIWLGWVLSVQRGSEALILLLIGLLFLALAIWVNLIRNKNKSLMFFAIVLCALGLYCAYQAASKSLVYSQSEKKIIGNEINWEPFDSFRLNQYLLENKPVFLDFTAAWCLSCQVNERMVFYNQKVINRFEQLGIIPIKADWTNQDPEITKALNGYGKNSIPLYVLYPQGKQGDQVILPEIITPAIMISTLDKYFVE